MSLNLSINRLLPQTQCRECGYDGCRPYADALAAGSAPLNLCAPGGETVIRDLAVLLKKPVLPPAKVQTPALAWIDEAACIGCTACIRACPVDAIMGASKLMHTVLADECTGCGLCVTPCPVDCIHMLPVAAEPLPRSRRLAESEAETARFQAASHAQNRYQNRLARKQRDEADRKARLQEREAAAKAAIAARAAENTAQNTAPNTAAFNPAALIAQAMARAQVQQTQLSAADNHHDYRERQIEEARRRANYRRAMRDSQYGSDSEKAAAIEWLRRHKAEQEAAQNAT